MNESITVFSKSTRLFDNVTISKIWITMKNSLQNIKESELSQLFNERYFEIHCLIPTKKYARTFFYMKIGHKPFINH